MEVKVRWLLCPKSVGCQDATSSSNCCESDSPETKGIYLADALVRNAALRRSIDQTSVMAQKTPPPARTYGANQGRAAAGLCKRRELEIRRLLGPQRIGTLLWTQ